MDRLVADIPIMAGFLRRQLAGLENSCWTPAELETAGTNQAKSCYSSWGSKTPTSNSHRITLQTAVQVISGDLAVAVEPTHVSVGFRNIEELKSGDIVICLTSIPRGCFRTVMTKNGAIGDINEYSFRELRGQNGL